MADVQLEHGYIRLAHALFRALMRAKLGEREKSVVMSVWDRTYGAQGSPVRAPIGSGDIGFDLGIDRADVKKIVRKLVGLNVLEHTNRGGARALIGVVKDFDLWRCEYRHGGVQRPPLEPGLNRTRGGSATPTRGGGSATPTGGSGTPTSGGSGTPPPKTETRSKPRSIPLTPLPPTDFDTFWTAYPRKVSKGQARKTWAKLTPDEITLAEILAGLERAKQHDARFRDGFTPHASSWLNAEGWTDEHDPTDERRRHDGNGTRRLSAVEEVEQGNRERAAARERDRGTVGQAGENVRPPLEGEFRRER